MTFKVGDVVEYRGPYRENCGKQYTVKEVFPDDDFIPFCHVVEDKGFAPHLKNLIHVNVSLENE